MTAIAGGSVVIPAHNEAAVIGRCLSALEPARIEDGLEVAVVCNGCTDTTAAVAAEFRGVRVLELRTAAKSAALQFGDTAVESFPRIYLDADVILPAASLRAMLGGLRSGDVLACRPPLHYACDRSSWLVRRYYSARSQLPTVLGSLWGAGVYGLSEAGRDRFETFPDVVADDLWIDSLFDKSEMGVLDCAPVTVQTPRHARAIMKVLQRTYRGNDQLSASHRPTTRSTAQDLSRLAATGPQAAMNAAVYASFAIAARVTRSRRSDVPWERDDSSRVG